MSPRKKQPPAYRLHRPTGQAVVTLTDARTGKRRDVYLGVHDTPASRTRYANVLAGWEESGRVLSGQLNAPRRRGAQTVSKPGKDTITGLVVDYWNDVVKPTYDVKAANDIRLGLKVLRSVAGAEPAAAFGPKALKRVRQAMIDDGLAFNTIKQRIQIVKRVFAWAVEEERIPGDRHHALKAVKGLKRDAVGVKPPRRVLPVPEADIAAVERYVAPQVWALIRLQLVTGARPGELVGLRPVDVEMRGSIWTYEPDRHKNTHRGLRRVIRFGPQAQSLLVPYLVGRPIDQPFFSPAEANAARKAENAARGRRDGQPETPRRTDRRIGDTYSVDSYRRAITRACAAANIDEWTPHRLRHNAATTIRRQYGLEAAQLVLGHSSATVTDAVYAERDTDKIEQIIAKIG